MYSDENRQKSKSNTNKNKANHPNNHQTINHNNSSAYHGPETLKAVAVAKKAAKAVAVQNFMVIVTASVEFDVKRKSSQPVLRTRDDDVSAV